MLTQAKAQARGYTLVFLPIIHKLTKDSQLCSTPKKKSPPTFPAGFCRFLDILRDFFECFVALREIQHIQVEQRIFLVSTKNNLELVHT